MNSKNKRTIEEENPFWDCRYATVRRTGEIVRVENLNMFDPDRTPEWVQVGSNGMHLRYFSHYELEFL